MRVIPTPALYGRMGKLWAPRKMQMQIFRLFYCYHVDRHDFRRSPMFRLPLSSIERRSAFTGAGNGAYHVGAPQRDTNVASQ